MVVDSSDRITAKIATQQRSASSRKTLPGTEHISRAVRCESDNAASRTEAG